MKVPADCPGVLDKAAKKAFREEKRASIAANSEVGNGDEHKPGSISRSNTMTSTLSSSHSIRGNGGLKAANNKLSKSNSTTGAGSTRRAVAPPPDRYVSASSAEPIRESPMEDNAVKGRMLYTYTARGEGEITVEQGKDLLILEPDGMCHVVGIPIGAY